MQSYKDLFVDYITNLQDKITENLEKLDTKEKFIEEAWDRVGGGGGRTRVLSNGRVLEKAGVNISIVHGKLPDSAMNQLKVKEANFFACGISLVIHPKNPFVPTVHANFRYFELYNDKHELVDQWFGGGSDLTPYYYFKSDATHFHQENKNVCDQFDLKFYPKFKEACDDYFYNHHRKESRGIGGLFIDYLRPSIKNSMEFYFNFITSLADNFLPSYLPIVEKRMKIEYENNHKNWQELRRGRYVEFNLIHDKGTLFGLKTGGRIESILMSLPPKVQWIYNFIPKVNSKEEELIFILTNPIILELK